MFANRFPYLIIVFFGALLFIPFLGQVHLFDWDEINFAESAREMMHTHNYMQVQINYLPFWEKPPLFFWMQVLSMKAFGVNEFAARLPNAICGITLLSVLFYVGSRLYSKRFAWWMVLVYAGSFLPQFYFKSGIIDPWFNLFIFLGIFQLTQAIVAFQEQRAFDASVRYGAIFTGLAILTKGPVALLVVLLSYLIVVVIKRKSAILPFKSYLQFIAIVIVITLLWFGLEVAQNGWWFLEEFINYQIRLFKTHDAGHSGFFLYHFVVLFVGAFPVSLLIYRWRGNSNETLIQQTFRLFALVSFSVVILLFTMVQTKIIHYSSFCYLPMAFLAAYSIEGLLTQKYKLHCWQLYCFLILGLIWSLITMALPLVGMHPEWLRPFIQDSFGKENLNAMVDWNYALSIPGLIYGVAIVMAFVWLRRLQYQRALLAFFISTMLFIQVVLLLFVPRVEEYSQGAAIEFFEGLQQQDCYVTTLGYKSYAPYFYSRKKPERIEASDNSWLLRGKVDKPTYIVCKCTSAENIIKENREFITELYRKNGFVFFKRK